MRAFFADLIKPLAAADGRFAIPAVPPGAYHLKLWGPRTRPASRRVEVPLPLENPS